MEKVYDTVDNIWTDTKITPPYGEERMSHLIKTFGSAFGAWIEKELSKTDMWSSSFSDVRMKLNECIKISKNWKDRITDLTGQLWKADANWWNGKAVYDKYLERLIGRLSEIFEIWS